MQRSVPAVQCRSWAMRKHEPATLNNVRAIFAACFVRCGRGISGRQIFRADCSLSWGGRASSTGWKLFLPRNEMFPLASRSSCMPVRSVSRMDIPYPRGRANAAQKCSHLRNLKRQLILRNIVYAERTIPRSRHRASLLPQRPPKGRFLMHRTNGLTVLWNVIVWRENKRVEDTMRSARKSLFERCSYCKYPIPVPHNDRRDAILAHERGCPSNPLVLRKMSDAERRLKVLLIGMRQRNFRALARAIDDTDPELQRGLRICLDCFHYAFLSPRKIMCEQCGGTMHDGALAAERLRAKGVRLSTG